MAFTGLTGTGKTLSMVMEANRLYKNTHKPIFSNFKMAVWDYEGKGLFKHIGKDKDGKNMVVSAEVLKSDDFIEKLMVTKAGIFLVDEAGFVFNNRKWRSLPFEMVARFQQSRKLGVDILYTTQNINRVDMTLRELTHVQVMCSMENLPFIGEPYLLRNDAFYSELIGKDSAANRELYKAFSDRYLWWKFRPYYQLYDTLEIVEFSVGQDKKEKKVDPNDVVVDIPPVIHETLKNYDRVFHTLDLDGQSDIYVKNGVVVHIQYVDQSVA